MTRRDTSKISSIAGNGSWAWATPLTAPRIRAHAVRRTARSWDRRASRPPSSSSRRRSPPCARSRRTAARDECRVLGRRRPQCRRGSAADVPGALRPRPRRRPVGAHHPAEEDGATDPSVSALHRAAARPLESVVRVTTLADAAARPTRSQRTETDASSRSCGSSGTTSSRPPRGRATTASARSPFARSLSSGTHRISSSFAAVLEGRQPGLPRIRAARLGAALARPPSVVEWCAAAPARARDAGRQ